MEAIAGRLDRQRVFQEMRGNLPVARFQPGQRGQLRNRTQPVLPERFLKIFRGVFAVAYQRVIGTGKRFIRQLRHKQIPPIIITAARILRNVKNQMVIAAHLVQESNDPLPVHVICPHEAVNLQIRDFPFFDYQGSYVFR